MFQVSWGDYGCAAAQEIETLLLAPNSRMHWGLPDLFAANRWQSESCWGRIRLRMASPPGSARRRPGAWKEVPRG